MKIWGVLPFFASICISPLLWLSPSAAAQSGIASVYGKGDGYAWRRTASGARMNPNSFIAAHRTLPFGTRVTVVNKLNGKRVVVRIVDRGPFVRGRIIDLSPAAAGAIGVSGLAPVKIGI
jgi:rare lipoprotein A